jgi:geranylgeranyl diphosphate synthase type I
VDRTLAAFLADRRAELAAMDPGAAVLVDEMVRLLEAGGKRIRPALCVWAFRAAGGTRDEIAVRAGAALELLHTFALVHDDVMDRSEHRRGVAATHVRFAREAPPGADPEAFGAAVAVLVGDLAAVLAERLLGSCGAEDARLARARSRFDRMRTEMAAGQLLDLAGGAPPERVATLKTGSYTAEGPVSIGSALAGAGPALEGPLQVYAGLLGPAFQLRDDVLDRDASPGAAGQVNEMVARAVRALDAAPLEPEARRALVELARLLELEG